MRARVRLRVRARNSFSSIAWCILHQAIPLYINKFSERKFVAERFPCLYMLTAYQVFSTSYAVSATFTSVYFIINFIMKGLISGVIGLGTNLAASAFNHKLAEKSAKAQYERQLSFWEKQNAYNDPAAQRRRLEAAGFNAAAASGQIAGNNQAGSLSSVPGNDVAQRGIVDPSSFSNSIQMFSQLKSVNLDNEFAQRQIQLSYIEELIKKGELHGISLSNEEKDTMLRYLDENQQTNLKLMLADLRSRNLDNHRKEADNAAYDEYRNEGGNQYREQRLLTEAQTNYTNAERETIDAIRSSEVALREAQVASIEISNALEERFGALERQASIEDIRIRWRQIQQAISHDNALFPLKQRLMRANISAQNADAALNIIRNRVQTWDAEFLASLVGEEGDWYDLLGRLLYELATDFPFTSGGSSPASGKGASGSTAGYTVHSSY